MKTKCNNEFELASFQKGLKSFGVDEVGRGCLAGPVVAAAVLLPDFILDSYFEVHELKAVSKKEKTLKSFWQMEVGTPDTPWWLFLNDSKKFKAEQRKILSQWICSHATTAVAWASVEEIDEINILHASMLAMRRALKALAEKSNTTVKKNHAILVDGHLSPYARIFSKHIKETPAELGFSEVVPLVKGDQRSVSIAAASLVAKVYRDEWMDTLAQEYPGYDFEKHKGYSTPSHYRSLEEKGYCSIHRKSFDPIKQMLDENRHPVCRDLFDDIQIQTRNFTDSK